MNYHQPQFEVNSQFECTLEKAIGLSEEHQELARFGSSPFNPDRTHRWPLRLSETRRRLLNNRKNARALAKRGDAAAKKRARKIECELGRLELEARQLHRIGHALSLRLAEVAKAWSYAWIAFVKVVTEFEALRKQGIAPERHHLLALVWLKRHGAQSRVEIARRLWNGDRTPKDPEDIWIGGPLWKHRIEYRSGSIWSVHCDLSERSLWQSDALRRAVRVRKSISIASRKVKHLWHSYQHAQLMSLVFKRVPPPWMQRDRAYNSYDLKRENFEGLSEKQRAGLSTEWAAFEQRILKKPENMRWDHDLSRPVDVLWAQEDTSDCSRSERAPLQQASHVRLWKLRKRADGAEFSRRFDPTEEAAAKMLHGAAKKALRSWKVSWCGAELARRTAALNRAAQPLPGLKLSSHPSVRAVFENVEMRSDTKQHDAHVAAWLCHHVANGFTGRIRAVMSNLPMRLDQRQHHAHVEAWLQHYIRIGTSFRSKLSTKIRKLCRDLDKGNARELVAQYPDAQVQQILDWYEHCTAQLRLAIDTRRRALRTGWSDPRWLDADQEIPTPLIKNEWLGQQGSERAMLRPEHVQGQSRLVPRVQMAMWCHLPGIGERILTESSRTFDMAAPERRPTYRSGGRLRRADLNKLLADWTARGGQVQHVQMEDPKMQNVQTEEASSSVTVPQESSHEGDNDDKGRTIHLHDE